MILSADGEELLDLFGWLPQHAEQAVDAPPGHPFFGAGFVFIGSILVVELLAGQVWRRSQIRTMLWPLTLAAAGLGMVVVTYVQPTEKTLHFILAMLLLSGGLMEARYRLGKVSRSFADAFAVPALIVGGFVIGPMHANGPLSSGTAAQMHLLVGVTGWLLAGITLVRLRLGATAVLDTSFATGVMMLGLSLLLVQQFHAGH